MSMKYNHRFYRDKKVIVTGGASFIGSTLVERLVSEDSKVTVIDDFSTGSLENLSSVEHKIKIIKLDLSNKDDCFQAISQVKPDIIFHLAAIHGGRGFIETFQKRMLLNSIIDSNVFNAGVNLEVENIVHASSACAYPINLQSNENSRNLLKESEANFETPGGAFPDGTYGWMKLMGEYFLKTMVEGSKTRGRSARIFTAYGERENESHAAVALTAKALLKMDPFEVWGSGSQTRNFTYVADTVTGLMLLGQDTREIAFDVFNVGNSNHWTVREFVDQVLLQSEFKPKNLKFNSDMPTGVASRAADNSKMLEVFGWEPKISIDVGVGNLILWYKNWSGKANSLEELIPRLI